MEICLETTEFLTVDDFIRTKACRSAVIAFRDIHFPGATAVPVVDALGVAKGSEIIYVRKAAGLYGYGYGYGDGYGDGDGDGDGYGDGYGDGDADGDGDGYGYGDGYG